MPDHDEHFGAYIRRKRTEAGITLRKFAAAIDVSPTYISQVERGVFKPPGENTIKRIAQTLSEDEDELLALANKVSGDLPDIIRKAPKEAATFLRTARNLTPEQWEKLTRQLEDDGKEE
jgi:HTH-type transcriptional regulator, competence development regulator